MATLEEFVARLRQENERQNLVSVRSLEEVWSRHIADSAQLLDHSPSKCELWLDLGTGAGFPGIIVALMRQDLPVHLVESRKLRIDWLNSSLAAANARNARVIGSRLEDAEAVPASVISARAFAPLRKLIDAATRFSTSDTVWLLPKGRSAAQEVAQLPPKLRRMFHVEPSVTDADAGIVVGRIAKGQNR
ncbi:16S rRNA (guanine(527)-N(7))-methyltransferase RsmG [Tsuneonella sp. HG249]